MEGKFCDGRTYTLPDSVERRGEHGLPVQRIRDLAQDQLQIVDCVDP